MQETEQKGKIRLLSDLGTKLSKYIEDEDPFADSFSFLKPPDNASIGEKVLWEVFGSKQQKTKPQVVTETGEKMAR